LSEDELVRLAKDGDPAAVNALWRRSEPSIRGAARQVLKNPYDCDDVVSESYFHFSGAIDRYRGVGAWRSYIRAIGRNQAVKFIKEQVKIREVEGTSLELVEGTSLELIEAEPIAEAPWEPQDPRVIAMLEEIDKGGVSEFTAFSLTKIDGISAKQAAEEMGISEKEVRRQSRQTRARLRRELGSGPKGA
jgi:RNA polymerase sigma-70 factor (ECF subfamily)